MQAMGTSQRSLPSTFNGQGLCLLSLDGGGVRGLSALYVLKQLMDSVNDKAQNKPALKPCDYFDMICGTSTGGIIAIMLGRLRMDVQECIDIYLELADKVFSKVHHLPVNLLGRTQGRYNQEAMETAIVGILKRKNMSPDALMKDDDPFACKVFVCAKRLSTDTLVSFTSYKTLRVDNDLLDNLTILQACRATSAAPTYFDPLEISLGPPGAQYTAKFVDGGLGYNNPVEELWIQATNVWKGPLAEKIDRLVSIGTGKPVIPDYGTAALDLGKRLLAIATNSEDIADRFYENRRHDIGRNRYFRFNVDRGLEDVELGEAKQKGRIIEVTKKYLDNGKVFDEMEDCVEKLASREWLRFLIPYIGTATGKVIANQASHSSLPEAEQIDISWLTSTTKFVTWMTPLARDDLRSRWLCYPGLSTQGFSTSFIHHFQSRGSLVLRFDCEEYNTFCSQYQGLLSKYHKSTCQLVAIITWSLVCQIIESTALSTMETMVRISELLGLEVAEFLDMLSRKSQTQEWFGKTLMSALYTIVDRPVILLIDYADDLPSKSLTELKLLMEEIGRSERLPETCRIHPFITYKKISQGLVGLEGVPKVDENTERQECFQSLNFNAMDNRRSRISPVILTTDHWLWSHPSFCSWIDGSPEILWIHGKPGCGKSVIARSIEHSFSADIQPQTIPWKLKDQQLIFCSWFYSARDGLVSHQMMLRSILLQILHQQPSIFDHVKFHLRQSKDQNGDYDWTVSLLQETLVLIANHLQDGSFVLCVIDGLDESDLAPQISGGMSRDDAFHLLERLAKKFRILILSRYHSSIERRLRNGHQIVLDHENLTDVQQAVKEGLSSLLKTISSDELVVEGNQIGQVRLHKRQCLGFQRHNIRANSYGEVLRKSREDMLRAFKEYLVNNASGVILWVVTVLTALTRRVASVPLFTLQDLWQEVKLLPSNIMDLYAGLVIDLGTQSPEAIRFARRALMWVNFATTKRPFQLNELFEALRIPQDIDNIDDENPFGHMPSVDSPVSFYRHIRNLCGPFIELIRPKGSYNSPGDLNEVGISWRDHVQLLHHTAKDFLESSDKAGPFRITFDQAEQCVDSESVRYLKIALPIEPHSYVPLPVCKTREWKDNVERILDYLEEKALIPFILVCFPSMAQDVPNIYCHIFENTTSPACDFSNLRKPFENSLKIGYGDDNDCNLSTITQHYFQTACIKGCKTAIECLFVLTGLGIDRSAKWTWYVHEFSIIGSTIITAIRCKSLHQVRCLLRYIHQRGFCDLLWPHYTRHAPHDGRQMLEGGHLHDGIDTLTNIPCASGTNNGECAVIKELRSFMPQASDDIDIYVDEDDTRDTINSILQFWCELTGVSFPLCHPDSNVGSSTCFLYDHNGPNASAKSLVAYAAIAGSRENAWMLFDHAAQQTAILPQEVRNAEGLALEVDPGSLEGHHEYSNPAIASAAAYRWIALHDNSWQRTIPP